MGSVSRVGESRHLGRCRKSTRPTVVGLTVFSLLWSLSTPGLADDAAPLTEAQVVARVTGSIDRALEYLASKQKPDGSWHTNNAVNGLALLAFLGRGHVPGRGPYREVVDRGKAFILASARADGYLAFDKMYEHGLATLALAEMYGMDPDPKLREVLRKAVDLIVRSQAPNGGWRYQPTPNDHDLSVTVMQVVALRAANNAEIPVPAATIDRAIAYVRSCANPNGGYSYQPGSGPGPQTTAAGVLCLQLLGKGDDPSVAKGLALMASYPATWENSGLQYFYYYHYYAIQAYYHAGGKSWDSWHPKVREMLLAKQNSDGSWDVPPGTTENEGTVGPNKVYWTAMACLVLEIYTHYLPAYQR